MQFLRVHIIVCVSVPSKNFSTHSLCIRGETAAAVAGITPSLTQELGQWYITFSCFCFDENVFGVKLKYLLMETFKGENFRKFRRFVAICESFSIKFGGVVSFGTAKASNPRNHSLQKSHFSPIRESFLSRKFPANDVMSCEIQTLL